MSYSVRVRVVLRYSCFLRTILPSWMPPAYRSSAPAAPLSPTREQVTQQVRPGDSAAVATDLAFGEMTGGADERQPSGGNNEDAEEYGLGLGQ